MTSAFPHAALIGIILLAMGSLGAYAEEKSWRDLPRDITLDIDHDGNMDRAVLVEAPGGGSADLYIYLGAGDGLLDLSRKPALLKKTLTANLILGFESKRNALIVKYGCGGCSNDFLTTLTIAHRGGAFMLAGYRYDWETRTGAGHCDINFLTGKSVISRGLDGKSKPIAAKFAPVKLAYWSDDKRPKACASRG